MWVWQERQRFEQVKRDIAAKGADDDGTAYIHIYIDRDEIEI